MTKVKRNLRYLTEIPFSVILSKMFCHVTDVICLTNEKNLLHRKLRIPVFNYYHEKLKVYLKQYVSLDDVQVDAKPNDEFSPIWIMWYQGIDKAPDIVKMCYNSVCQNAGSHPVIVITKDNYMDYVSLPDYIVRKVEEKKISLTHLSDIIRFNLLYERGGLWLDSTLLLHYPLPSYVFSLPFFSRRIPVEKTYYRFPKTMWCGFLLGSCKRSVYAKMVRDAINAYWECHDVLVDYFLIDYFIAILYGERKDFKEAFDAIPMNNSKITLLFPELNKAYDESVLRSYVSEENYLSKLSYKKKLVEMDKKTGKRTLYGYLKEKYS